jgi:aryl-alcohol dehydrogenase-like predicted oxidoreductase
VLTPQNVAIAEQLEAFAKRRDRSLLELAMSWLAHQPRVASVIAGATSADQVTGNAQAATWRLSEDELIEVDQLTERTI